MKSNRLLTLYLLGAICTFGWAYHHDCLFEEAKDGVYDFKSCGEYERKYDTSHCRKIVAEPTIVRGHPESEFCSFAFAAAWPIAAALKTSIFVFTPGTWEINWPSLRIDWTRGN